MNAKSAVGILLALAVAVLLGLLLRWQLAGLVPLTALDYAHLRHVHTHLGFYGALLPLAWIAAAGEDDALPRFAVPLYALFVVLAHVGFALSGYGVLAIAGSTGVLAIWMLAAWRRRRLLQDGDDWLWGLPLALPIAGACIPPIAVLLRRNPPLSASMVQVFLSVLVLGVLVPSALHVVGARPLRRPLWLLAALLGAAGLGFEQASLLVLPVACILLYSALQAPLDWVLRALWIAFGLGAFAMALGLLRPLPATGVAALHFAILGPVLPTLAWPYVERVPAALRVLWALAVTSMAAAILLASPLGAAITGTLVVVLLAVGVAVILLRPIRANVAAR